MELNVVLVLVGATLMSLGLLSRVVTRLCLSGPLIAVALGALVGPELLGAIDPSELVEERKVLEEAARLTLAVALTGTGLQITRADLRANAGRAARLLTVTMVCMWLAAALGAWLLLDLSFETALLLGAVLTPTDPVVASSIVSGKLAAGNLPRRLRRTLMIEAGANDGLALPFVLLAGLLVVGGDGVAAEWGAEAGQEVGIAIVAGAALGVVAATVYIWGVDEGEVDEKSLLGAAFGLAVLALGLTHVLGGSGVLASFVAALVFSARLPQPVREELSEVQEAITRFFLLPVLVLFGAMLPWHDWRALGGAGLAFAAWVLFLRRPPAAALGLVGSDASRGERVFLSWFGPLGVAAVFYATYIERFDISKQEKETIFAAATLAIVASILVHSVTATPGTRVLGGRSPFGTVRRPLTPAPEERDD